MVCNLRRNTVLLGHAAALSLTQERLNQDAEEQKKKASRDSNTPGEPTQAPRREDFPEIKVGGREAVPHRLLHNRLEEIQGTNHLLYSTLTHTGRGAYLSKE